MPAVIAKIKLLGKPDCLIGKNSFTVEIIETENRKFVSQTEKNSWNQKASINDSSTNVSETWSSVKLKQELDKKVNLSDIKKIYRR